MKAAWERLSDWHGLDNADDSDLKLLLNAAKKGNPDARNALVAAVQKEQGADMVPLKQKKGVAKNVRTYVNNLNKPATVWSKGDKALVAIAAIDTTLLVAAGIQAAVVHSQQSVDIPLSLRLILTFGFSSLSLALLQETEQRRHPEFDQLRQRQSVRVSRSLPDAPDPSVEWTRVVVPGPDVPHWNVRQYQLWNTGK